MKKLKSIDSSSFIKVKLVLRKQDDEKEKQKIQFLRISLMIGDVVSRTDKIKTLVQFVGR